MSDKDLIKENDLEFNQFVATEEDLRQIAGNDGPFISNKETPAAPAPTADKHGVPLAPIKLQTLPAATVQKEETHEKEIETDYNYVRNNLYTITERSVEALNNLSQIAEASQHPRAYEVLSLLVKTISDAQKDLISLHKEKVKIDGERQAQNTENSPEVVNNNLFVGTTAQLDEIIAKMTKKANA